MAVQPLDDAALQRMGLSLDPAHATVVLGYAGTLIEVSPPIFRVPNDAVTWCDTRDRCDRLLRAQNFPALLAPPGLSHRAVCLV